MLNYYKILGIGPGSTGAEIKAAYRRLALEHHPDKAGPNEEDIAAAAARFRLIAEAYRALFTPSARKDYLRDFLESLPPGRYLCRTCGTVNKITRLLPNDKEPICGVCSTVIPLTDEERASLRPEKSKNRRTMERIAKEAKTLAEEIAWAALEVATKRYMGKRR